MKLDLEKQQAQWKEELAKLDTQILEGTAESEQTLAEWTLKRQRAEEAHQQMLEQKNKRCKRTKI